MSSPHQNQINRLSKEVADLRKADAREAKKEADLIAKIGRANEAAGPAHSKSSNSTISAAVSAPPSTASTP